MTKDRYVAYDSDAGDYETFPDFETAEKWLLDGSPNDGEEFGPETCGGFSYIAKITHRTKYTITDKKENYHEHTNDCPDDCDGEEWPYDYDYETVGEIALEEVNDDR